MATGKTAEDNKTDFDVKTIDTVNRNFYVDDCVKSVATTDKAVRLVEQLPDLLSRGGFLLTKWISNRREILSSVAKEDLAPSMKNLNLDLGTRKKTPLGLGPFRILQPTQGERFFLSPHLFMILLA